MKIDEAQILLSLGKLPPERLPEVAVQALIDGLDCPSLCSLAAMDGYDSATLLRTFAECLEELDMPRMTEVEARRGLARLYAAQIVSGATTPYSGARKIWWESATPMCAELQDLVVFVGLASEIEDDVDPGRRAAYEQEILIAARQLLGNSA